MTKSQCDLTLQFPNAGLSQGMVNWVTLTGLDALGEGLNLSGALAEKGNG